LNSEKVLRLNDTDLTIVYPGMSGIWFGLRFYYRRPNNGRVLEKWRESCDRKTWYARRRLLLRRYPRESVVSFL
jgi:hypothetical protein